MKNHTITFTTKELETLMYHLLTDLTEYGVNGSWGDGNGWLDDTLENWTKEPNRRTKRGEAILQKLYNALHV